MYQKKIGPLIKRKKKCTENLLTLLLALPHLIKQTNKQTKTVLS